MLSEIKNLSNEDEKVINEEDYKPKHKCNKLNVKYRGSLRIKMQNWGNLSKNGSQMWP